MESVISEKETRDGGVLINSTNGVIKQRRIPDKSIHRNLSRYRGVRVSSRPNPSYPPNPNVNKQTNRLEKRRIETRTRSLDRFSKNKLRTICGSKCIV